MSELADKRIADTVLWYEHHKREPKDIDNKIEFLLKAMDCVLEILAILAKDVQNLERRGGSKIAIPTGIRLHGPIKL